MNDILQWFLRQYAGYTGLIDRDGIVLEQTDSPFVIRIYQKPTGIKIIAFSSYRGHKFSIEDFFIYDFSNPDFLCEYFNKKLDYLHQRLEYIIDIYAEIR